MSEVYSTPVHDSPEPQEVSVDTLAQEELEGMQSRLSALADAGTVADHVVTSFVAALPGLPSDEDVLRCSVATLGSLAMALVGPSDFEALQAVFAAVNGTGHADASSRKSALLLLAKEAVAPVLGVSLQEDPAEVAEVPGGFAPAGTVAARASLGLQSDRCTVVLLKLIEEYRYIYLVPV